MESIVPPMRLTKASGSINSNTESDYREVNSKKKRKTASIVTTSDAEISWTSRLSYRLHISSTYKIRRYSSKEAFLVLILNFLVSAGYGVPAGNGNAYHFFEDPHSYRASQNYDTDEPVSQVRDTIPILFWFPAMLVLGLLADIRYGRKRMVLFGVLLLWVVVLVDCARVTVYEYSQDFPMKHKLFEAIFVIDTVLSYIATAAFLVNSLQLAIDQLDDASVEQISSLIQWFVFTYFIGAWVFNQITQGPLYYCFDLEHKSGGTRALKVVASLVQVVFVSVALCLVAICRGWLRAIPIRNNPIKLIWQVLRFSAEHKYPVHRSALTYWEDDIPSRINLGKDKYGGPFTNEQVEDVKTFFRMISLALPCIATATSGFLVDNVFVFSVSQNWTVSTLVDFNYYNYNGSSVDNACTQSLYAAFLANINLWICFYVLCSEFIFQPLFGRCIPSMLKRIGLAFFFNIPVSLTLLNVNIAAWTIHPITIHRLAICCVITCISGLQLYLAISSLLEFICAQSPQSMKGFLIGFMWLVIALLVVISYFIYYFMSSHCTWPGCGTGYFILTAFLGIVGFVAYCVVAIWYRNRERDDCPNDQAIVEEVFARRLENKKKLENSSSFS